MSLLELSWMCIKRLQRRTLINRLYLGISNNGVILSINLLIFLLNSSLVTSLRSKQDDGLYTDEFAVKVIGGQTIAQEIASEHGFDFIGQVGELQGYYLFKQATNTPSRSKRRADKEHKQILDNDKRIEWVKQQKSLRRDKRQLIRKGTPTKRHLYNDPLWPKQWYLHNSSKHSMNVVPVWERNITGNGVVVTILDDGIEYTNDDLGKNYDPIASYDYNDNDDDPMPRPDDHDSNSHGTQCAGEVAMQANNGICGVGVAYNANIGGVRMLDGWITDALEARAIGHRNDYVDIYSVSWGPCDEGDTLERPNELAYDALEYAIEEGRQGKGSIFVWASGNGGAYKDNCNCDGYASNIYTISISAIENNKIPGFVEECSSIMAVTYSFSLNERKRLPTIFLHNSCTTDFCGTSASAPMAAGILALVLEANPNLTWRDVQHVIALTSDYKQLAKEKGWHQNGAGFWINHAIGFGMLNADAMVTMADPLTWKSLPESNICIIAAQDTKFSPLIMNSHDILTVDVPVDGCVGTDHRVGYLEHVELFLNLEYPYRGALNINLTSPSGTQATLLTSRPFDRSGEGFYYWPFMSLHTWGEQPTTKKEKTSVWRITVWDSIHTNNVRYGLFVEWFLVLHGTKQIPAYRKRNNSKSNLSDPPSNSENAPYDGSTKNNNGFTNTRLEMKESWRYLHSLYRH